jgi:hypothetical protein
MRFIRTALLLFGVALCAMSGIAQDQHWRGNIPFSFKIKNQTFPAGAYDISVDTAYGVVSLSNALHPGEHMVWVGIPADRKALATMRFAFNGDNYMLVSVAAGSWMSTPPHGPRHTQEATVVFPQ